MPKKNSILMRSVGTAGILGIAASPLLAFAPAYAADTEVTVISESAYAPESTPDNPTLVLTGDIEGIENAVSSLDFGFKLEDGVTLKAGEYAINYSTVEGAPVNFSGTLNINGEETKLESASGFVSFTVDEDTVIKGDGSGFEGIVTAKDLEDVKVGEEEFHQGSYSFYFNDDLLDSGVTYAAFGNNENSEYPSDYKLSEASIENQEWVAAASVDPVAPPVAETATTEETATFTYENVPAGDYKLTTVVTPPEGDPRTIDSDLTIEEGGESGNLEVALELPEDAVAGEYSVSQTLYQVDAPDVEVASSEGTFEIQAPAEETPAPEESPEATDTPSPSPSAAEANPEPEETPTESPEPTESPSEEPSEAPAPTDTPSPSESAEEESPAPEETTGINTNDLETDEPTPPQDDTEESATPAPAQGGSDAPADEADRESEAPEPPADATTSNEGNPEDRGSATGSAAAPSGTTANTFDEDVVRDMERGNSATPGSGEGAAAEQNRGDYAGTGNPTPNRPLADRIGDPGTPPENAKSTIENYLIPEDTGLTYYNEALAKTGSDVSPGILGASVGLLAAGVGLMASRFKKVQEFLAKKKA